METSGSQESTINPGLAAELRAPAFKALAAFKCQAVGLATPECPFCHAALATMPRARSKCPACRAWMPLKRRGFDGRKVLVTEQDIVQLLHEGRVDHTLRVIGSENGVLYDSAAAGLAAARGRWPTNIQATWATLLHLERTARDVGHHGIARNHRYQRSILQYTVGRIDEAIKLLCQCCYLDICGATHSGRLEEAAFPPWKRTPEGWVQDARCGAWGVPRRHVHVSAPFADGLLAELQEYRQHLHMTMEALAAFAAKAAEELVAYTRRAVNPTVFASELMVELERFEAAHPRD